ERSTAAQRSQQSRSNAGGHGLRFQMFDCRHSPISDHELSSRGARKSKAIAAATSAVATMSPSRTSQFDNGRAHASPSAHAATFDDGYTSQYPQPRQMIVAAMK